ncbi:hypothetical protein EZV62_014704 [Acer yangbiense]|uniref:RING-type E3 ubiquitin transferase n=1 Tax=Acer yangbiense TaxID=1000413 RepID=A0A5C7HSW8_9ROSI|nr:hypothetical protein EZV62_014704 [Acer yangbiense]
MDCYSPRSSSRSLRVRMEGEETIGLKESNQSMVARGEQIKGAKSQPLDHRWIHVDDGSLLHLQLHRRTADGTAALQWILLHLPSPNGHRHLVPIIVLLLVSLLSICVRNCASSSPAAEVVLPCTAGVSRGLDPCVIESFPLFIYSAVKDLKIGREALECAVCLSEFEDDDTLRLLPKCDHVFHRDCIGAWLAFHDTCPVCRANLTPEESNKTDQSTESNIELTQNNSTSEASEDRNQTVIHIYNESCINRSMGQTRNFFMGGLL